MAIIHSLLSNYFHYLAYVICGFQNHSLKNRCC